MIADRLKKLWPQFQGKKQHLPHHLDELRLWGIRGIHDLKVTFDYPVSVIAGGNPSGKSTVLFAAACAYKVPGAGVKDFVPSTLFPDYRPKHGGRGLLALCLPLYLLYALYFCQVTMLHGDEGQYLRVTQSLFHDGDMDLADNLEAGYTKEFHVREFGLQKAPASPDGKVHSVHPIGLSAALVPAYWWGLERWENPRLASSLFMALLASFCVPLVSLYRAAGRRAPDGHRGHGRIHAVFPLLQPALPGDPGPAHRPRRLGGPGPLAGARRRLPLLGTVKRLGSMTLLLGCLLFLHPRYAPLALLCGAGVLLQAWHGPRRPPRCPWSAFRQPPSSGPISPTTSPSAGTGWGPSARATLGTRAPWTWPTGESPSWAWRA